MKLYTAHWLEHRRRVSELRFNQVSDKHGLDLFPPLVSPLLSQLLPAPGLSALLLQLWDETAGPQSGSARILCCAGGHRCQERGTCTQLDRETSAPRRAEGSECWLAAQVAAGVFIWAALFTLLNELGWSAFLF